MFLQWLGPGQTIDLKLWACALGMRAVYLDTLRTVQGAAHVITLDLDNRPHEVFRALLDGWWLYLSVLPAGQFSGLSHQRGSPVLLVDQVEGLLPPQPPSICTAVQGWRGASLLRAAYAATSYHRAVRNHQLDTEYGRSWAIRVPSLAVERGARQLLVTGLGAVLGRILDPLNGRTLVIHRDGAPESRRGFRVSSRHLPTKASTSAAMLCSHIRPGWKRRQRLSSAHDPGLCQPAMTMRRNQWRADAY